MRLRTLKLRLAFTAALLSCAIPGCGPVAVRGTWDGTLVAIPPHGAATTALAGFDVAPGDKVPAAYRESAERDTPALLIDRERRAIDYETLSHLGGKVVVTGRMTFANVKTSDGSGWVCGPPPRGPWDSYLTCWVVEIDSRSPSTVRSARRP